MLAELLLSTVPKFQNPGIGHGRPLAKYVLCSLKHCWNQPDPNLFIPEW